MKSGTFKWLNIIFLLTLMNQPGFSQLPDFSRVRASVNFNDLLQQWDGFGVNYVETAQTFDYQAWPQDYGGFSILDEASKNQIVELVFGENGLQPDLIKMFLDPLHQLSEGAPYDHQTSTANMRYFVRKGIELSELRKQDLSILTTLYCPPGFMTLQQELRGRDMNPDYLDQLTAYMVHWVKYLKESEGFPVHYLSLHNEGESWLRWPIDSGLEDIDATGHDYNMFWSHQLVNDQLIRIRKALDQNHLSEVKLTPGETTNWYRFGAWGYAQAIAKNPEALDALGLITSHGFYVGSIEARRWFGPHSNRGTSLLLKEKPSLHSWCTSTSWDVKNNELVDDNKIVRRYISNAHFILEIHGNIYEAGVNGLIPWAFIQNASQWIRPDPNPGCAIRVYDDGTWEVKKGYYYYKQVSRAGKRGMHVVQTYALDSEINVIGFSGKGTHHPDAFVLANTGTIDREVKIELEGTTFQRFEAYRTSGSEVYELVVSAKNEILDGDNYKMIGQFDVRDNALIYKAPANSVTTFSGLR